jgi:type II secretory pathway component PulM
MNQNDNGKLQQMAEELESIKQQMAEMKAMLKDVHTLLAGNPIDKDSKGLISDFREMKIELDEIKNQLRKYKAYFYALVTLIGIGALKVIIQFLTSK